MENMGHIGLRIPEELKHRIEKLQERLSSSSFGVRVARSQLIRNLLERGLQEVERELDEKGGDNG